MDIVDFFQSKSFRQVLWGLGGFIILLLTFQLGLFIGFRKAGFSYQWANNYHRVFGGPSAGFIGDFEGRDFINGHGLAGTVIKLDGSSVIAKGSDGVEKIITTSSETTIEEGRQAIPLTDLSPDDRIVVLGTPQNDGSIEAKLIRVFDQFLPQPIPLAPLPPPLTPLPAPTN